MKLLMILFIVNLISVNCFIDVKLITSYFQKKLINYASIIGCFNYEEKFSLIKSLIFANQRLSFVNISEAKDDQLFLKTTHNHIGVILNADCNKKNVEVFLKQCGLNRLFDVKHHWLIITLDSNFSNIFENIESYINADINVVYPKYINSSEYIIEDIYNQASTRGGSFKKRIIGYFSKTSGYVIADKKFKYTSRRNMTGVTLKSIIVLPVPFKGSLIDYLNSEGDRHVNTFNRFHYSVMRPCVQYYNFTPNISMSKSWGYLTADGTFDGLVGALERHQVDYGSSPLFVRADRGDVMEYGRRTWILRAAFVFRNPKSINSISMFAKPLATSIWISLFCITICIIFILKYSQVFEKTPVTSRIDNSWSNIIVCAIAVFCQQGSPIIPFYYSGRITIFFMLIQSYLICQFYGASIVSSLLMAPKSYIKTVEDILKSDLSVGCEDVLYNRDYFLYTTDKASKDLYHQKILRKGNISNFLAVEDGLSLVKKGGYAFHVELAPAYPIILKFPEKSICELREVQMFGTKQMHSNLQKGSPFRDMFDTCLQRLEEYGIMDKEIQFWHPKRPECVQSAKTSNFNLGLEHFYPVLALLSIGITFSLIVLIIELLFNYKERVKKSGKLISLYPFVN